MLFGFGEIFGSQAMSLVIEKFGAKKASFMNLANILAMVTITLINLHVLKYNFLSFFMCFVWGWLDGSVNTHVNQNLGFQFDTVSEPFAVLGMLSGVGVFSMEMILNAIKIE